jgi:hypothetical protein
VCEFVMQQWRHNKAMLVPRSAEIILHASGVDIDMDLGDEDSEGPDGELPDVATTSADSESTLSDEDEVAPGLLLVPDDALGAAAGRFIELVARHRSFDRFNGNAMLPPAVDIEPAPTIEETAAE